MRSGHGILTTPTGNLTKGASEVLARLSVEHVHAGYGSQHGPKTIASYSDVIFRWAAREQLLTYYYATLLFLTMYNTL